MESMSKKTVQPELPSNRLFGYFFAGIFVAVGTYLSIKSLFSAGTILILLAMALAVTAVFKPDRLLPLNRLWMKFGALLGIVVSPIVMGLIYFGLFTPMGIVMRLFKRDELRLKIQSRRTYWKSRSRQIRDSSTFKKQF